MPTSLSAYRLSCRPKTAELAGIGIAARDGSGDLDDVDCGEALRLRWLGELGDLGLVGLVAVTVAIAHCQSEVWIHY